MDIGLQDGYVSPTLVPGVCGDVQPLSLPAPTTSLSEKYGFKIHLEIEPHEWESGQMLRIARPGEKVKRIDRKDMLVILDYIKKDARSRGYVFMPPKDSNQIGN